MSNPFEPLPYQRIIFDNLMNGVYFVDRSRVITYWNKAAELISGYKAEEVIGRSCKDDLLIHALGFEVLCSTMCPMLVSMSEKSTFEEPASRVVSLKHKHGYRVPITVRCVPLLNDKCEIVGAVEIFEPSYIKEDVAIRLKELGQFAYLDALTELPNRRYMEDSIQDALTAYKQKNKTFAIAMGDIDFFKNVNDQYGHDAGDVVLKSVGQSMRSSLRSLDIVGRWGGEEFIIILRNVWGEKLYEKLDLMRKSIEATPIIVENNIPVNITMSFGGAFPCEDDDNLTLVARADEYLYKSKHEGRNRVSVEHVD